MAIATTILRRAEFGDQKAIYGKSVLSGATASGDVVTGLKIVNFFTLTRQNAAQKGWSMNETLPLGNAGGTVSVVTETNDGTFYWLAIGVP